ncbi:MAG: hypothetical protein GX776_07605 [Oxalobacter sp.]|nr:hypothetical protein [Oxalobacter sp.]
MSTRKVNVSHTKIAEFSGNVYAHHNSMKRYHWAVTGTGSCEAYRY